jgi:hypothetical protein
MTMSVITTPTTINPRHELVCGSLPFTEQLFLPCVENIPVGGSGRLQRAERCWSRIAHSQIWRSFERAIADMLTTSRSSREATKYDDCSSHLDF